MIKQKNIFDYLNAIYYKKDIQYEKSVASSYILSLWLSHDRNLIEMVNDINHLLFQLDDEMVFRYLYYKVPEGRRFIRWPKKTEKDKDRDKKRKEIMEEYNISKREANFFV